MDTSILLILICFFISTYTLCSLLTSLLLNFLETFLCTYCPTTILFLKLIYFNTILNTTLHNIRSRILTKLLFWISTYLFIPTATTLLAYLLTHLIFYYQNLSCPTLFIQTISLSCLFVSLHFFPDCPFSFWHNIFSTNVLTSSLTYKYCLTFASIFLTYKRTKIHTHIQTSILTTSLSSFIHS